MTHAEPNKDNTIREIRIPSTLQAAKEPEREILQATEQCGYDDDATFAIKLALEEAMTNAVKHGNGNDESKSITVRYSVSVSQVVIIVRDEGPGFVPEDVPDPTQNDRLMLPTGRGIMLMRAYMDEVCYQADGREVRLVKIKK